MTERGANASLTATVQRRLTSFYALDAQPLVDGFVAFRDEGRERLLVRQEEEVMELALELPAEARESEALGLDVTCQVVEGVSHFVLVVERARCDLPTSLLELELQAEIDKFVIMAFGDATLDLAALADWHDRLFGAPRFVHAADTAAGERYRVAHRLGARLTRRLTRDLGRGGDVVDIRRRLQRFYRAGPQGKIAMAQAA